MDEGRYRGTGVAMTADDLLYGAFALCLIVSLFETVKR